MSTDGHHTARIRLSSPRRWLVPAVMVTLVMAALAAMYLGGSVNSTDNITRFPVAVVNADVGADDPTGEHVNIGAQITDSLRATVDTDRFDLSVLTLTDATQQMSRGDLYGAIVLPEGLSSQLMALTRSAISGDVVQRPIVDVLTNPLANPTSANVVSTLGTQAMAEVNQAVGTQLLADITSTTTVPGAARVTLSMPIDVQVAPYREVPDGTGGGISAFYYALLLILAGFTGSLIISSFVDAGLGFIPFEIGPLYRLERHSGESRLATLTLKWVLMAALAVVVSTAYLGVAALLNMPLDHPWQLWLFSVLAILAVAVVVQAVLALLGSLGLIVNLFLFIVLAIPSSGGTVPLEATPPFIRFLAEFEPMRQVYLGCRSILYFGATWDSGLGRAVIAAAVALTAGLIVGALGTRTYDHKGLTRHHRPAAVPA